MEKATKSQAINGTDHNTIMTPLRVKESILANGGGGGTSDHSQLSNLGYAASGHTGFQPAITDLDTIRAGAALGATSVQEEEDPVFASSPAADITQQDITNWDNKSTVSVNRKVTTGTNIADITVDGTQVQLYAPNSGGGVTSHDELSNLDYSSSGHTGFQATISDLSTIRSGASLGATAVQPGTLGTLATKDTVDYATDVTNKPTIPSALSQLTDDSTHRTVTDTEKTSWNGKSVVTIDKKTTTGTNIADITIDGVKTELYAPTGGGGSVDIDNNTITKNTDDEIQTVAVIDNKTSNADKFWTGTLAEYNAITTKDIDTFYNITDDFEELGDKEDVSNKVTTLSASSTNTQYPSAKAVYDGLSGKQNVETVLYDNNEGSNDSIALSDSAANYDYIEIFFKYVTTTLGYASIKIYNPNNTTANLSLSVPNNNYVYIVTSLWGVRDNNIIRVNVECWRFNTSGSPTRTQNSNDILIYRVVGYKN